MAEINLKILNFRFKFNNKELVVIGIIIALAAFLRLYRISEYMTFLGDEGRDAIIVRRLLVYADPILIGPGTSIGNMYLGPLYYYFMAPWLWLAGYSPVGPAVGVALLGIATVFLVYWIGKEWFGTYGGQIAALLYAVSPVVIIYSRSSWNPNIMPFFATLCIYSIWKIWHGHQFKWFILLGISFGFVLQSHYLGLLLAPVFLIFWILTLLEIEKLDIRKFLLYTTYSILLFALLMSPLVIFDARHGWRNFGAIKTFFTDRQSTVSVKPWNSLPRLFPLLEKITNRLVAAGVAPIASVISWLTFLPLFLFLRQKAFAVTTHQKKAFLLIFVWVGVALVGLGLYKQEIYDHYYGFFFTALFLLLGGIFQIIINSSRIRGASIVVVGVTIIVVANLLHAPILYAPNRQLQRTQEIADAITSYSGGKKFNLAVIAERNYDAAYRYFLEVNGTKVVDIDPQNTYDTITSQLFVVCETPKEKCDPTHNPKTEVANFGWSKIAQEWEISGMTVFKLEHTQ
jgi:4-amino-4-deoxy-L-arabinose transferase-like glycosyltransferase